MDIPSLLKLPVVLFKFPVVIEKNIVPVILIKETGNSSSLASMHFWAQPIKRNRRAALKQATLYTITAKREVFDLKQVSI